MVAEQARSLPGGATLSLNPVKTRSEIRKAAAQLAKNRSAVVGGIVLTIIILVALFAPLLAPEDPITQDYTRVLTPPSSSHPFGTDQFGRDILSRIIIGSRQSLAVAAIAIAIAASLGTLLGLLSGFFGGWIDTIIQRVIDVLLAFPGILFAMAVVAILGPGLLNAMIAVGISLIPSYARMVRGSVLSQKENAFVEAARLCGAGNTRILARHILPNVLGPIMVLITISIAWAILIGASLSFLGLGAQLPEPEWGLDLSMAREYLREAWWMTTFPGLAIMITVVSVNLIGEGLRDALDPRTRSR
jgi:ABC-type dipeptide/oligopeptide/nickel transport system permease subunit